MTIKHHSGTGQGARETTFVDQHVGRMLKLFRRSRAMTQSDLAGALGITFQQIQKYERGTNRVGASRLWALCRVLDVAPGDFFAGLEVFDTETPGATETDSARPRRVGAA